MIQPSNFGMQAKGVNTLRSCCFICISNVAIVVEVMSLASDKTLY